MLSYDICFYGELEFEAHIGDEDEKESEDDEIDNK